MKKEALLKKPNSQNSNISTKVSGKIILSGEYSVLYDKPALVIPINKYLSCNISNTIESGITIELNDLKIKQNFSSNDIRREGKRIETEYSKLKNKIVLKNFDLTIYTLHLIQKQYLISLDKILISIKSEIPINYGLGSSAGFIVCLLKSLKSFYKLSINENSFLKLAIQIENIIHGKSSGIDINAVFYNKPIFYHSNNKIEFLENTNLDFFIINTGKSESSTKQCINHVNELNKKKEFWKKFEEVTLNLKNAILKNDYDKIKKSIKINHKLLCKLNVVPKKIKTFIEEIEEANGTAKITGAGNIKGNNAGMLIVFIKNKEILESICKEFNFKNIFCHTY